MKSNPLYIVSAILLVVFSFTGCKKYEEGPDLITLRTVKSRLTNGEWILKEFIADGVDSTEYYNEIDFSYNFEKISSSTDDFSSSSESIYKYTHTFTYLGQLNELDGHVYFEDGGDYMRMTIDEYAYYDPYNYYYYYYDYPSIFGAYFLETSPKWKIEKLTNKEFWLTCKYNSGKKYSMKLSKK